MFSCEISEISKNTSGDSFCKKDQWHEMGVNKMATIEVTYIKLILLRKNGTIYRGVYIKTM